MNNFSLERKTINVIVLLGIALSLIQFFFNRSLWLDESLLALNIIHKSHSALLQPLDLKQVAPILFLQIEKIFSTLFNNTEFGLRIFPLINFVISLFLFSRIIKSIHKNYYTVIFSLSILVFNVTVIYYSSEVKQYMTDILVLMTIYYFTLKEYTNERNKYYFLGIIGMISVFLSNVSPIILFTVGFYLLYSVYLKDRKLFSYLVGISFLWVATFLFYYFIFIENHPTREGMIQEWTYYDAFLPTNPLNIDFFKFLYVKWSMIVFSLFDFGRIVGYLLTILLPIGIVSLFKKREYGIIILVLMPLTLHLFLSGFKLYPFDKRLILYTLPLLIIIASFGFNYLLTIIFDLLNIERFQILALLIPIFFLFCLYIVGFPIRTNEIKKSIEYVQNNMEATDKIFVNDRTKFPFQYYQDISSQQMNNDNIIKGKNTMYWNGTIWTPDTVKYSNELNLLKGRIWFIFTDVGDEPIKKEFLTKYFSNKGESFISEFDAYGSSVYLYDLGD